MATIANSLSKAALRDVPVMRALALAVRAGKGTGAELTARHCALILNAYAKLSLSDVAMFAYIAEALLCMPPQVEIRKSQRPMMLTV